MTLPEKIKQRNCMDPKLGIKSSLSDIRVAFATLYVLFLANNKKSQCFYSVQNGDKIVLPPDLSTNIKNTFKNNNDFIRLIENSPLFQSQFESLFVFISLIYSLGVIKFNNQLSDSAERTGGKRYAKNICFSANMIILDAIISSYDSKIRDNFITEWLNNRKCTNNELEQKITQILQVLSEQTVFKLRLDEDNDLILQTEGIYDAIKDDKDQISIESLETVGPFRIIKSALAQGLNPYLQCKNNIVSINPNISFDDFQNYRNMVSTLLDISRRNPTFKNETKKGTNSFKNLSLQQIYYGAPGTGKSYMINELTKAEKVIRTTFHPDSDYSTFVGCYKPTMKSQIDDDHIVYEFVAQAFLKAYVQAWELYAMTGESDEPERQYLVIEEINRGNCAQIFGDLFQLLDRNESGFSDYYIHADTDLKAYLNREFIEKGITTDKITNAEAINALYKKDVVDKVLSGEILLLPNNLYIWATMNTSDQSLFPIDSAFKRRWDWIYVPIANVPEKNWKIVIDNKMYSWWDFLEKINEQVGAITNSEDKKLGFFFCQANNDEVIDANTFVSKVLFYLWNDVFKDYGFDNDLFKIADDKVLTFDKFYKPINGKAEIDINNVQLFLKNLKLEPIEEGEVGDEGQTNVLDNSEDIK